jgi:hypothetical protein
MSSCDPDRGAGNLGASMSTTYDEGVTHMRSKLFRLAAPAVTVAALAFPAAAAATGPVPKPMIAPHPFCLDSSGADFGCGPRLPIYLDA